MLKEVNLYLPIKGEIISLTNVEDYLFNRKILGEGAAINPHDNYVYSPVDGEVEIVYDTKHAILIKTEEGLKILIHLGLNTLTLEGLDICSFVKIGDKIKKGDKLLSFNKEFLQENIALTTPVIIVNTEVIKTLDINYDACSEDDIFMKVVIYS